ncbi:MAG: hypothetical protein HYX89_05350 [Chloroflexi bacterium]|nr:hypothetical protein [Chloroflexota bacterium]
MKWGWTLIIAAAVVLGGCAQGSSARGGEQRFPGFVYASAKSLEGYRVAVALPELLSVLPCYCGCGPTQEHLNLKQCFITPEGEFDQHAAGCDLCVKEALDAQKAWNEGKQPAEIRQLLEQKYQSYGPATDTPPISSERG